MREIVHIQVGQCGNQIGAKVRQFLEPFLGIEPCDCETHEAFLSLWSFGFFSKRSDAGKIKIIFGRTVV